MRYIIVDSSYTDLRRIGRKHLAGQWKQSALTVALFLILLDLPLFMFSYLFELGAANLYVMLVSGPLSLGISAYYLKLFRREPAKPTDILYGFEYFLKALGLYLVMALFIVLWSLLFIIPGIIAACRYSQAFFILADDPGKGVMQCIRESKERMYGNKGKFFLLGLSFIGWIFLATIPTGIIAALIPDGILSIDYSAMGLGNHDAMLISYVGNLAILKLRILNFMCILIPISFITAYIYSTYAGFYEILVGNYNPNVVNGYASEEEIAYTPADSGVEIATEFADGESDDK